MVENHYEFIVTYENRFYFSTSERTCPSTQPDKAKRIYKDLCERFPESEGFNVLVSKITCYGQQVTLDFIKGDV